MRALLILPASIILFLFAAPGCGPKACKDHSECDKGTYCSAGKCQPVPATKVKRRPDPGEEEDERPIKRQSFNKDSNREKQMFFKSVAENDLRNIVHEREAIFVKIRNIKITHPPHKRPLARLLKQLETFRVGLEPDDIEDAPERLCEAFSAAVKMGTEVWAECGKELKTFDDELKKLDEVEKAFVTKETEQGSLKRRDQVKRKKNNTLTREIETKRNHWSNSHSVVAYLGVLLRNILKDAYILADLGAKRTQKGVLECLTPYKKHRFEFDYEGFMRPTLEAALKRAAVYEKPQPQ